MQKKKQPVKTKITHAEPQVTKTTSRFSFLYKKSIQVAIITVITFACYFNTVFNEYSLDDDLITDNVHLTKGFSEFKYIWTHAYAETGGFQVDYRPISLSVFSLEFMIFGRHPGVSHMINVFLYIICLLLLYFLSIRVFKLDKIHPIIPLLALLLYSIHPSHTEVVSSFKNRDEIISFIFIICFALFFNKIFEKGLSTGRKSLYIVYTLSFLYLSMLTKFTSPPFVGSMFLWAFLKGEYKKPKFFFGLVFCFIFLFLLHIGIFEKFLIHRNIAFTENPVESGTDIAIRFGVAFNALLFYFKFLFIPFPSRYYYGFNTIPFESIANPLPLLSLLIYILLAGLFLYSVKHKKNYAYFLGAFLMFAFFYSNIIFPYTGIVSERAMLHFSFFFIVFVILLIYNQFFTGNKKGNQNKTYENIFAVLFCIVTVVYSSMTIMRNTQWKTSESLISHDIKYMETSAFGNYLAGTNFYHKGMNLEESDTLNKRAWMQLSLYYLNKSIELSINEPRTLTYYNLGNVYRYGFGDLANSEKNFLIFEKLQPDYKGLAREIASVYFLQNKFQLASPYYEKAIKEEPDDSELLFYRSLNFFNVKDIGHFLPANEQLQKRFPNNYYAYLNYGSYYLYINDEPNAVKNLELAVKYGSANPQVLDYLARYYIDKHQPEKAAYYEKVKASIPLLKIKGNDRL
ncbi:MAG: tetratricopeptide repeat protein [Bacteroidota bacterium]|nr:tetratricopeptide repeat protein [Bacteroidota bacterium]